MWRKLLHIISLLLLTLFVVLTFSFSVNERKDVSCASVEVKFSEDELIKVSEDEIISLVKKADKEIIGKELKRINADVIEKEVEKHQAILNAEVYKITTKDTTSYKGLVGIRIKHREPIVRIMSSTGSYYLDENAEKIPVSTDYSANVLVTTGFFDDKFAKEELLPFIMYLRSNEFWNAQIEQIHVEENKDIILTPLIGDHLIELGPPENYEEKLLNMKAFYNQVIVKNNWNKYERISLKYKDQVIAKKR
jgi:cell division protein FtsQ